MGRCSRTHLWAVYEGEPADGTLPTFTRRPEGWLSMSSLLSLSLPSSPPPA